MSEHVIYTIFYQSAYFAYVGVGGVRLLQLSRQCYHMIRFQQY